jgi:hypothetical protein
MDYIPSEFAFAGIFMPPLLIAGLLGIAAAVVTVGTLDRLRLSQYFFYPPLVFVALAVIYAMLIGTFIVQI